MTLTLYLTDTYEIEYSFPKYIEFPAGNSIIAVHHDVIIVNKEDVIDNYKLTLPDYTEKDINNFYKQWDKIINGELKNINMYFLVNPDEELTDEQDILILAHIDKITPIYY